MLELSLHLPLSRLLILLLSAAPRLLLLLLDAHDMVDRLREISWWFNTFDDCEFFNSAARIHVSIY